MTETTFQSNSPNDSLRRLNHAMGPVLAGMIIDAVDLITFGPAGLALGIPVGALAGYWLGQSMGLDKNASCICALAAGVYCMIPFTEVLPLGTIVGALVRYENNGDSATSTDSQNAIEGQHDQKFDDVS
jgi:hypothetical protein